MRNNRKFCRYLSILMISAASLAADSSIPHSKAGTSMFPFLDLGYDARSIAMGSASIGVKNDIGGVYSNPAALYLLSRPKALMTYKPVIMDIRAGSFAYGYPVHDKGVLAANLVYLSYGTIDGVDKENKATSETYNPYAVSGSIMYAARIGASMGVGVSLKGIYDKIGGDEGYSADGFALDAGWQYSMRDLNLTYGIIIRNLGFVRSGYSDDSEEGPLPFTVGTGLSYRPAKLSSLLLAFDMEKSVDDYLEYAAGGELSLFDSVFMIRLGYSFSHRDLEYVFDVDKDDEQKDSYQKTNWNTVSAGFGINADVGEANMNVDAALNFRVGGLPPSYVLTVTMGI